MVDSGRRSVEDGGNSEGFGAFVLEMFHVWQFDGPEMDNSIRGLPNRPDRGNDFNLGQFRGTK